MPGWSELDKMLNKALSDQQPAAVAADDAARTRDGLTRFFQPAFDVFTALSEKGLYLQQMGSGSIPRRCPDGAALLAGAELDANQVPYIYLQLAPTVAMQITVAVHRGRRYPENVTTAKWRCRIIADRTELTNELFDGKDALASWVIRHIIEYSVPEINETINEPPPVVVIGRTAADDPNPIPNREPRTIQFD